jgi:hypothetical protein
VFGVAVNFNEESVFVIADSKGQVEIWTKRELTSGGTKCSPTSRFTLPTDQLTATLTGGVGNGHHDLSNGESVIYEQSTRFSIAWP